jgi:hypothetical protein
VIESCSMIIRWFNDSPKPLRILVCGRGNRAINIGRFKTYKARKQFDNWGRKDAKTLPVPNSFQTGV